MADVNANIRIDIDTAGAYGELRRLQSQISNFNNSLSTANASAAAQATALNKALKDGINASGMFEARMVPAISSVERFSTALEKNKLSLGEYTRYAASQLPGLSRVFRKEWDTMEQVATSRVKKLNAQYLALGKSAKGAQEALQIVPTGLAKGYATDLAIATQRQQIFNKLIDDGSTKLLNWGKNTQWAGRQLMVGFSLPLAALGAAAAKTFMELDKASTAFERVYGDLSTTTAEMERNKDAVMTLGAEYTKYGIAVKDTLELSARVAATGLQNEDMLAATEQTLRFATLGQMDYNEALDATISLQSAFNVASKDLGSTIDYLNAVENQTVLTIQDMAAAIPRVAPVIQGLGGDVKDLAVMMTAMREGGVSAENAANALKSGLASLINPTQRAQESMAKLGIDMQAIIDTNRGDLLATVTAFGQALSKVDEFSQQQALEQIFGKYQYARMGALFNNIADGASQASRAMDLAGMSASELAQLSEKELGAIAESTTVKFEAAMERLKLSIAPLGEAFLKGVMPIMEFLSNIANAFNNLPDPIKNAAAVITAVVAGLGPVFLMTIGLIGNGIANLVKGIQFFRRTIARIKGDASSFGYLADAEMDAKVASEQLEGSVTSLTRNLHLQRKALGSLITQYGRYAQAAGVTAAALPNRRPAVKMARGGVVPGTGSGDKVPALLEPGETVVTKKASQKYGPVIAAMNAGNLPGYQDGLNIPNVSIPENAVFRKGSEQSISKFFESISHMSGAANAATRVLQNLSDQGGKITAKAFKQAMIEEGIVPSLPSGRAAAHLTKRGDISETGMDWLESRTGRGEGGKSVTAQNILALAKDPEMAGFVKEYSGLTADLSQTLNTQLQTGAAVADFNREWSETGSRLLPSLQTFGDFVVDGADDLEALNTFERELGNNINARSDVMETGMVTDDILEEETRKLINQYKDTQTSMGKVARAADTASKTIGQVSIAMSEAEAEDLVARGMATRSETDKETRYLSSSGAVLGRKSKDSGTWRPERYGRLARAGASITQTAARSARDAIRSASPSEEFAEIMEDAAEGALVGAKRSASVSRKAGQVVGQSAKEAYKAEMSQLRRDVRNVGVMEKGGMKDATMQTRTLRRLRESEARAEQAKLVEAKRSQQLAERAARDARVRNIAETAVNNARQSEIRELTRMQKLSGKLGGVGRGIAGRAGTVGMGLGMASMIPFMAQNEQGQFMGMDANALGMGMGAAGMAFDMVGLAKFAGAGGILGKIAAGFAAIAGPLAIATAAIGAVGIGMYLWRKNVDESSKQAAEFGANVGGASNALNKMAEMLGRQTPAQRAAQVRLGVTAEQSDQMAQWAATFEDGSGKQFIDELKAATSEERFSKLSDYLKYAIAAGMMDAAQAETFANAVAVQLGDSILGMRAKTAIAGQETGTKAMLALAANRAAAVKGTEGYQQVGIVRGNATDQFSTTEATNADQVIGGSMQVIQDYANAAALAAEELASGKISQAEYQSAIQQSNDAINRATFDMTEAMYASDDLGGSMQALKDQLAKAGISAENAEYIAGINQKQVAVRGKGAVVVGATTEQLRSEAAAAAMQGMDVENIKAITEYMQGEDGGAVSETFKRIASNKESQGQAYGLAAFQMSLEQGALGDQIDQGAVMEVAIKYVEEGGTAAELQQFLMTLPPEVVTKVITDFEGMTPEEQKKYVDSYNQLLPSLGAQSAYDVTQASGGKVDPETAAAAAQLKQIFGSDQETITRYVNIALNTEPRDISETLPEITKNMEDINKNIPQDIQKLIGIDLKNPQDVEKYGPLSEDINALVPAINALPEGQKEFAISIMMKQNGKEVKDPIKFAKDMVKYQKTLAGLSSDN